MTKEAIEESQVKKGKVMNQEEARKLCEENIQRHAAAPVGAAAAPASVDWVKLWEILRFLVDAVPVGK